MSNTLDNWKPIFVNQVIPKEFEAYIQALTTEARANERQAMLDMPELQDEYPDTYFSTVLRGNEIKRYDAVICRDRLREQIRTAIKKIGEPMSNPFRGIDPETDKIIDEVEGEPTINETVDTN